MALTQAQKALISRVRAISGGTLGVELSDAICSFLTATIIRDLGLLDRFSELASVSFPEFFSEPDLERLTLPDIAFIPLFERLVAIVPDADTYFACLATLHKSRLKYVRIISHQPQETGYLFEPIIANAIGGVSLSAAKSPIRRHRDPARGRQVDCIRDKLAYEIKMRVTIAASGQGRWQEELDFPVDCRVSGYTPVLVVFDPTPSSRLEDLANAFRREQGEVYIGEEAWRHLMQVAGDTMSRFIEKYVRLPIQQVLNDASIQLPKITFAMTEEYFLVVIDDKQFQFKRRNINLDLEAI
ncbi:hypothetical protein [Chloroflexus sp.]|uniref:hypothetical protein n=1 Tax=Chloroflexus sp. TaxID=1904827 RepID=UPI002ACD97F5|nr:hypothetical protein [Chloroflexus sp.]